MQTIISRRVPTIEPQTREQIDAEWAAIEADLRAIEDATGYAPF